MPRGGKSRHWARNRIGRRKTAAFKMAAGRAQTFAHLLAFARVCSKKYTHARADTRAGVPGPCRGSRTALRPQQPARQ